MEICVAVLGKLAEYTVEPVRRQFSYLIHCESNIDNLTRQAGRLADKRDGIQIAVDAANRNIETIAPEVESWLRDVNNTIEDKGTRFKEETVAKAKCCNGWFPNLKYRHSLSREAKKMTVIVDKLLGDGSFAVISHPAPPPEIFPFPNKKHSESVDKALAKPHEGASSSGTSNPAPPSLMKLSENLEYRLPYTKEVMNALHNDDINMIGICGIIKGGDTVTAKEFIQIVKHQDIFEEVVMAVVSHDPDLKRIQVEIGDMLGLNLENMSLIEGAEMLHARMSSDTERFLVVLADVWKILDLEAVGIPHGESNQGCKIIFLSRLPNVFSELRTQSNFKLLLASISVEGPMNFESRSSVLTEVMNALTDDQINPIVICGMPGIGKTTLVKEVGKKAKEGGLFDEVAMAVMTQDPDLSHIQDEIADFLGLKLIEQSLSGRANKLCKRLSGSKRVLVILDNVSTPVDLEALGIPLCCDKQGCKILVSSRSQDIFNEIKTKKNFPIGVLKESEAWCLFKESAGDSIESPELHSVAHQVLSECAGLPIAISTVGRALQHKSKRMWIDAVRQLRKACPENIPGVIQEVYGKIKLSYLCLSSKEAQSCFLLCCLYPESGNILVDDLVKYGVGLGLFDSIDSMEDGRNSVETLIDILKSCFLLLDSNKKGCVRMHDVVRDVALFIISEGKERFLVRCEVELKDWPKINSVSKQYMCSTLINNQTHQHIGLLLLSSMDKLSLEPPSTIFEGMGDLKVLGMRSTVVLPILPSLPLLRNLQTLCLEHCNFNNDHVKILNSVLGKLRTLMILSFRGSCIKELPDELKNLSKLRLLDLTGCIGLELISPGVISSLTQLEELYMWNSFDKWVVLRYEHVSKTQLMRENPHPTPEEWVNNFESTRFEKHRNVNTNAELSELLSLSCLTSLETALPPTKTMQSSVAFRKLERFKISIGFMDEERRLDVSPSENYLRLHDLDGNSLVGSTISVLLKKTNTLDLKMKNLKDALNFLDGDCFVNLKSLTLQDCEAMEYLIDMTDMVPIARNAVLPVLDTLNIQSADRMKEICHGQLPMGSFEKLIRISLSNLSQLTHVWKIDTQFECLGNLRCVVVRACLSLKFVFLLSTGNDLMQLEELEITSCPSLEEIFTLERSGYQIKCLNLIRLSLINLRFFKISKNACTMSFPQLITLELRELPELISLYPSHLASKHSSNATNVLFYPKVKPFCELRYMVVSSCNNLLGVFSSSVVQNLQNLEQLEVRSCDSLETVFELEGLEIKEEDGVTATLLSCLEKMELYKLPMLAYLWKPPQNILAFQNLTMLQVFQCNRLEYVFPLFILEGLVKLEAMFVRDCPGIADIFAKTEEHGDEEKTNEIVIPQLKTLHFTDLLRLKRFCPGSCTVDCPSLRTLVLTDCGDLETFVPPVVSTGSDPIYLFGEQVDFPVLETLELRYMCHFKEIWKNKLQPHSFCELRDLNVSICTELMHLVPMFMQNRLPKLEKLHVSDCRSLEGIFELRKISTDEGEAVTISQSGETPSISQPERTINQMDYRLTKGFPNLTSIKISGCNNLRYLLSLSIAIGLVKLTNLSIDHCQKMEEIIAADGKETEDTVKPFRELRYMVVSSCNNLLGVFSSSVVQNLQNLEQLEVRSCDSLETVFELEGLEIKEEDGVTATLLSCLEKMELYKLPMLAYLWKPPQNILAFQNLTMLQVFQCNRLEYVFPLFILEGLVKLEAMFVRDCPGIADIFAKTEEHGDEEKTNEIVIPQLKTLHFTDLLRLKRFCPGSCTVDCPSLRTLVLTDCGDLETFVPPVVSTGSDPIYLFGERVDFPVLETLQLRYMCHVKEIWKNKLPPHSFCELRDLNVFNCMELLHLVPMFMQNRLLKLEKLHVSECRSLEEIFELRELSADEGEAVTISQSGETSSISQPERIINQMDSRLTRGFPNLTSINISHCNNLRNLLSLSIARGLVKLKNLSIDHCQKMEEIIAADGKETEDTVVFPILETLEIRDMDNFKEIFSKQISHNSFCELRDLNVSNCMKLLHSVPMFMQNRLPKLEKLHVSDCRSLEGIFELRKISADEGEAVTISQSGETPSNSQPERTINQMDYRLTKGFPNLTSIKISGCNNFRYLFSLSIAIGLVKLKNLSIDNCHKMEEIIAADGKETEDTVVFPFLETLEIHSMDNFKEIFSKQISHNSFCELRVRVLRVSFCNKLECLFPIYMQNGLQKLESLTVKRCSFLVEIFECSRSTGNEHAVVVSQSVGIQSHQGFQSLTSIEITECERLRILLSPRIARGLRNLKTINIYCCGRLKEIVTKEVEETDMRNILPQLTFLKLDLLINLISFSQGKYILEWPLMKEIQIEQCPKMKKFCFGSLSTPREVKLIFNEGTGVNLRRELKNSRKLS